MKLKAISFFLFLGSFYFLSAQQGSAENASDLLKMIQILPPAPNAASLGKYGGINFGLSSGMMSTSIPIYTYSSKSLQVPISISYSSNGFKVDEISSRAGVSWNLNAGGVITRTVYGAADEYSIRLRPPSGAFFPFRRELIDSFLKPVSYSTAAGTYDAQPDRFSFNFCGYSGQFILDSALNVVLLEHSNLQFEFNDSSTDTLWDFKVTSADGIKYYFGGDHARERTDKDVSGPTCGWDPPEFFPTAYYLKKIIHPNNDSIEFTYNSVGYNYKTGITQSIFYKLNSEFNCDNPDYRTCPTLNNYIASCINWLTTSGVVLKEINSSSGGRLVFKYRSRLDVPLDSLISRIELYQPTTNALIRVFDFTYQEVYCNSNGNSFNNDNTFKYRYFLKSYAERSVDSTIVKKYGFEYNDLNSLPGRLSFAQDDYGFYNGKNNSSLLPKPTSLFQQSYFPTATADRRPNSNFAQMGLLSKITYPTGGSDSIFYEGNTIYANQPVYPPNQDFYGTADTQGDAVAESANAVISFDQEIMVHGSCEFYGSELEDDPIHNKAKVTFYEDGNVLYQKTLLPGETIASDNIFVLRANSTYYIKVETFGTKVRASADFLASMGNLSYQYVNQQVGGVRVVKVVTRDMLTQANNIKKYYYTRLSSLNQSSGVILSTPEYSKNLTVMTACDRSFQPPWYTFDCKDNFCHNLGLFSSSQTNLYSFSSQFITYSYVTESFGENFENGGIEHQYTVESDMPGENTWGDYIVAAPLSNQSIRNGKEIFTHAFKKEEGAYIPTTKIFTHFKDDARYGTAYSAYVINRKINPGCESSIPDSWEEASWDVARYEIFTNWSYPDTVTTFAYDPTGQTYLTTTVVSEYGNLSHALPTKLSSTASDGSSLDVKSYYPADLTLTGAAETARQQLIAQHIIAPVLKKESLKAGNLLTKLTTAYKVAGNGLVLPESQNLQIQNNADEKRIEFVSYNNFGQLVQQKKVDDVSTSYIWGYNSQYPIAEVINSSPNRAAYTSFEEEGKGNWMYSGIPQSDNNAVTGTKTYILSSGSISINSLNNAETYIVSYWSKNGVQNVNVVTGIQGPSHNGWTYFEHKVSNPTNGVISISGTGTIDELRLYPVGAEMISYTYDPLIGVTSQADANNKIICYEYDGLGRVLLVRDQDRNILKKYCYNYSGQNASCLLFQSSQLSQSITRNNCGSGYQGGSVTYTVPAGKYVSTISQADADAQAQADVTSNGQIYANQNGSCSLIYYSVQKSGSFTKDNCATGGTPGTVTYTVAAGTYNSTISQAAADQLAQNDVDANGQAYANANGTCTFYNVQKSGSFTRDNCATGGTPATVTYTVAAGTYSSIISQANADQLAQNDVNANGQAYANTNGTCTFYNVQKSSTFTKNNCAGGGTGSNVIYTVAAGTYSSTVSQAAADQLAQNDINTNGQTYANNNGYCTFYNVQKSGSFTRNNCAAGGTGSSVTYTVAAGTYSSTTSQAAADQLAQNDVNTNGQAYANNNGYCTWWNIATSSTFTKNNCTIGGTGSSVTYTVPAGTYSSTTSQAAANTLAQNDVNANGQAYANSNGYCTWYNAVRSGTFTRNNCSSGYIGSTVTYTVAAGTYSSTTSQAAADQLAQNDVNANGQSYANANGTCTQLTIYAKIILTDQYNDAESSTATVLIKFFSDNACTVPVSVTNLSVNYKRVRTNCNGTSPLTTNYSATCSGTQYSLGTQTTHFDDGIHCWNYVFSVTAGTGYVAK